MLMASDWVPKAVLHEADDWQDLLTEFNQKSVCSSHRMEAILERLEDRSAMLSNRICSLLDRVAGWTACAPAGPWKRASGA